MFFCSDVGLIVEVEWKVVLHWGLFCSRLYVVVVLLLQSRGSVNLTFQAILPHLPNLWVRAVHTVRLVPGGWVERKAKKLVHGTEWTRWFGWLLLRLHTTMMQATLLRRSLPPPLRSGEAKEGGHPEYSVPSTKTLGRPRSRVVRCYAGREKARVEPRGW